MARSRRTSLEARIAPSTERVIWRAGTAITAVQEGSQAMRRVVSIFAALGALALGAAPQPPALAQPSGDTLAAVRARGVVACGVAPSDPGFSIPDSRGVWRGLDVDHCRAVAAAV